MVIYGQTHFVVNYCVAYSFHLNCYGQKRYVMKLCRPTQLVETDIALNILIFTTF